MLKPLPTRKIDAALAKWGTNLTTKDVARLNVENFRVEVDLVGQYYDNFKFDKDDNRFVDGCKQLYGGNLSDVVRIEVFNYGYAVHLKTDVRDGNDMVCEVKVGGLC